MTREPKKRGPGRPGKMDPDGSELLLRAAQSAFALHGYEGARLRQIAASAGVDPALASHHFGSKEALWEAVVERLAIYLKPFVAELTELQKQVKIPIRSRIETAFRRLIVAVCEEPEGGMLVARISAERGDKLDLLVDRLLRPYHDAFKPLLREAMQRKVIAEQPIEVLYFMLLHAVIMTVSFRHVLGYFGKGFEDIEQLQRDMTRCVLATFLERTSR